MLKGEAPAQSLEHSRREGSGRPVGGYAELSKEGESLVG
jgi:hypothetical protein